MNRFPYTVRQIEDVVRAEKYPRDWEPVQFSGLGDHSRRSDTQLERLDGRTDRIRLIVRVGRVDRPLSYAAALLLEDEKIRGIDYHLIGRSRLYKQVIPKGWHEDVVNPNLDASEKGAHARIALPEWNPTDVAHFLRMVCRHWSIVLPAQSDTLL